MSQFSLLAASSIFCPVVVTFSSSVLYPHYWNDLSSSGIITKSRPVLHRTYR